MTNSIHTPSRISKHPVLQYCERQAQEANQLNVLAKLIINLFKCKPQVFVYVVLIPASYLLVLMPWTDIVPGIASVFIKLVVWALLILYMVYIYKRIEFDVAPIIRAVSQIGSNFFKSVNDYDTILAQIESEDTRIQQSGLFAIYISDDTHIQNVQLIVHPSWQIIVTQLNIIHDNQLYILYDVPEHFVHYIANHVPCITFTDCYVDRIQLQYNQ